MRAIGSHAHVLPRCTLPTGVPGRGAITPDEHMAYSPTGAPYLCEVELQRVVRAQADIEADLEEIGQRVPLVREEQCVVAQRAHR